MPIDCEDLIGRRSDDQAFDYDDTQIMLYNLSVGMDATPRT